MISAAKAGGRNAPQSRWSERANIGTGVYQPGVRSTGATATQEQEAGRAGHERGRARGRDLRELDVVDPDPIGLGAAEELRNVDADDQALRDQRRSPLEVLVA